MRPFGKSLRIEDVPAKPERKIQGTQPVAQATAMVIELPVPIRVGSGKYNLLLVPVEVPANTGGRVVEREQGLGVIRAAMRAAIVRAGEAYLKATFP